MPKENKSLDISPPIGYEHYADKCERDGDKKKCKVCKQFFGLDGFYQRHGECKKCSIEIQKAGGMKTKKKYHNRFNHNGVSVDLYDRYIIKCLIRDKDYIYICSKLKICKNALYKRIHEMQDAISANNIQSLVASYIRAKVIF